METNKPATLVDAIKASITKAKENYKKPTPWNWRLIGDTILIIGTTATSVAGLLSLSPYVVAGAAIVTALGKIFTNFNR